MLATPALFGVDIRTGAADAAHIGGAVVIVAAVVAWAEAARALRLLNVAAGLAIAGLVFLADPDGGYAAAIVATGLAVAVLSLPRGQIRDSYSNWHLLIR